MRLAYLLLSVAALLLLGGGVLAVEDATDGVQQTGAISLVDAALGRRALQQTGECRSVSRSGGIQLFTQPCSASPLVYDSTGSSFLYPAGTTLTVDHSKEHRPSICPAIDTYCWVYVTDSKSNQGWVPSGQPGLPQLTPCGGPLTSLPVVTASGPPFLTCCAGKTCTPVPSQPIRDCVTTVGDWSECPCGGYGTQKRTLRILQQATAGGKACDRPDGYVEMRPCYRSCSQTDLTNRVLNTGWRYYQLSAIARCSGQITSEVLYWRCGLCKHVDGFEPYRIVYDKTFDVQALLGYDRLNRMPLVAFRGSYTNLQYSLSVKNWASNIVGAAKINPWDTDLPFPWNLASLKLYEVHSGFWLNWLALRAEIRKAVYELTKRYDTPDRLSPVLITGHSMGGALAQLAAVELAWINVPSTIPANSIKRSVRVWTFGSPRVGTSGWVKYFMSMVDESYRFTNYHDFTTPLPPMTLGYEHPPQEVYMNRDKFIKMCSNTLPEDQSCQVAECGKLTEVCISLDDHKYYFGFNADGETLKCQWAP